MPVNTSSDRSNDRALSAFPVPPQRALDKGKPSDLVAWTRRWVEGLPTANPDAVVAQVGAAAGNLNRLALLKEDRIQVLEILSAPARESLTALCHRVCGAPDPLREKDRVMVDGAIALHRELAVGYRCVLSDATRADRQQGRRGGYDAIAAFRALSHLDAILQICYRVHLKPGDSIWGMVYGLYLHARAEGIAGRPLPPNIAADGEDVEGLFKRVVLLSVSAPESLRRVEVGQLIDALPLLSGDLDLTIASAMAGDAPQFVAELNTGEPPRVNGSRDRHPTDTRSVLFFDPAPLIARLAGIRKGSHGPAADSVALPPTLVETLLSTWTPKEKKRSSRKAQRLMVVLVAGFREVHAFLDPEFAAGGVSADPPEGLGAPRAVRLELLDPGVLDAPSPAVSPEVGRRAVPRPVTCSAVNHSAGGYRLAVPLEDAGRIAVGEVIILREEGADRWTPALVKWVVSGRKYSHFGVELMAPGVQPGVLRGRSADGTTRTDCLLLPASPGTDGPLRLATRPLDLCVGEHLRVLTPKQVLDVVTGTALHRSPAFDLYAVDLLRRTARAAPAPRSGTRSGARLPLGFDLVQPEEG